MSFVRQALFLISVSLLLTACGGGSGGDAVSPDDGSDTTGGELPDMNNTDMSNNSVDVASAIKGVWMSTCKAFNSINTSEREINLFTDTQLIRDWYTYENTECAGVPRGRTFPQRIYSYEIGSDIMTADGIEAKELNLVVDRVSVVGYLRDAVMLGQSRYDIVAVDNGMLLRTGDESTSIEGRPNDFSIPTLFTPREPITADTVSPTDFVGTFRTNCEELADGANSTITNEISTDTTGYTERVEFYFGTECEGEVVGVTERYYQETFGDTFKTPFGDTMIAVDWSRTATVIVEGEDVLGGLDLGTPRNRFDAYALVNGNTLMRGYCLNNSDDCKKVESERPDMIDLEFNSDVRYTRVE